MDLGLPGKFRIWRPRQLEAVDDAVEASERFVIQVQPVGSGKSLSSIAVALKLGCRTMYLTSTKGLQDQAMEDFEAIGLTCLKGKSNYTCALDPNKTCEEGIIGRCYYKDDPQMCTWRSAKQALMDARLCITNYSCWMAANKYGQGLGEFDLLIADEAHHASTHLEKAMQILLSEREIIGMLQYSWPDNREEIKSWKKWAEPAWKRADGYLQGLKEKIAKVVKPSVSMLKDYKHYDNLKHKLADIATFRTRKDKDEWVVDGYPHGYQFDPIYPHTSAEKLLFRKIPKVLLTSGTISSRIMDQLGILEEDCFYKEYERENVDTSRSPLIYLPVWNEDTNRMVYVDRNTSDEDLLCIVRKIDEIIECWGRYKGIVHSVSFKLRDYIVANSQYSRFMISNYTGEEVTADVIRRFKAMAPPAVLVSPSVTTGYDFPFSECRYQIFPKVPFSDPRPKIERARNGHYHRRYDHITMERIAQAFGRGDRGGDGEWQKVFVLDSHWQKFWLRNQDIAPVSLRGFVTTSDKVQLPPINGGGK